MAQMQAAAAAAADNGFRVGRVFGRSFGVLSRHFVMFFLVVAVPSLPLLAVQTNSFGQVADVRQLLANWPYLVLGSLLGPIIQAIVLYGTFQDLRGQSFGFVESFVKGLPRFLPIIGLAICLMVLYAIGAVLLAVPALIFIAMYFVALPACVIEKTGPIASLSRSAALTKGHRWKVFGLAILLAIASFVGNAVISAVASRVAGAFGLALGGFLWRTVFGAYYAIVIAVVYYELRASKEGLQIEQLAAVFA
jgi:uncharacterized membrane protein